MANQIMGWEGRVEYVAEATYGSLPYSSTLLWIGDVRSFSIKPVVDKKERARLAPRGSTTARQVSSIASGMEHYSCKIEYAPQISSDLYSYLDFVAVCIGASTGQADARTSIVINAVGKETVVEGPLKGAVNNYFQCKVAVGEDVIFEAEFLGIDWDPSAPLVVTSDLSGATDAFEQAVAATGAVMNFLDVSLTISGTVMDMWTGLEFKIDNKAKERPRMNSTSKQSEIVQGIAVISGKVAFDLSDNVELLRLTSKASFAMVVKMSTKSWTFTGCEWKSSEMSVNPDDPDVIEIPFTALSVAIA